MKEKKLIFIVFFYGLCLLNILFLSIVLSNVLLYFNDIESFSVNNSKSIENFKILNCIFVSIFLSIGVSSIVVFRKKAALFFGICLLISIGLYVINVEYYSNNIISKIRIEEVCTRNSENSDYIELYNDSDWSVDLSNFFLTKDREEYLYFLPKVSIPAHGYYIYKATGDYDEESKLTLGLSKNEVLISLYRIGGVKIDEVSVPKLKKNEAYSRDINHSEKWGISVPTPGFSSSVNQIVESPVFSADSGFYNQDFWLELSINEEGQIYYTLDGTIPTCESYIYTEPIHIINRSELDNEYVSLQNVVLDWKNYSPNEEKVDKLTIVKAVSCVNGNFSDVITKTYVVDLPQYENCNLISITSEPQNLFGEEGIYVTGKEYDEWYLSNSSQEAPQPNFMKDTEITGELCSFSNGIFQNSQMIGIRIQGASNRREPLKRFSLYSRSEYSGSDYFTQRFFDYDIHSIVLRPDDADAILHRIVKSANTSLATMESWKTALFVNGEFWYWCYVRPKYSERYISQLYGVEKDNVAIIKRTPNAIYNIINKHNNNDEDIMEILQDVMDLDSYIDYIISNVYLCNMDYSEKKNVRIWNVLEPDESKYGDGRYRWMIYDMDCISWLKVDGREHNYQINTFKDNRPYAGINYESDFLFMNLMKSDTFREKFVIRFMDLSNEYYRGEKVESVLEEYGFDLSWQDSFFAHRFDYIVPYMAEEFELKGSLEEITISQNDSDAGKIKINTIVPETIDNTWKGLYYTDYMIRLEAIPNDGYVFREWFDMETGKGISENETIELKLRSEEKNHYVAVFEKNKE